MKPFSFFACFLSFLAVFRAAETENSGCQEKRKALALLETAEDLLTKAKNDLPSCQEKIISSNVSECGEKKPLAYIEISKKLISEARENFPTCPKEIVKNHNFADCSQLFANGHKKNGVYTIWPAEGSTAGNPLQAYCDMTTDGGGWTVIQRRGRFTVQQDFYQDWGNYKRGFGNITEEFWLGNENIRILCYKRCEIRFDLTDKFGGKGYAVYKTFYLLGRNYKLYIQDYIGNAGDSMKNHNLYDFSTKDNGNLIETTDHHGGWWYGKEGNWVNLNGINQFNQTGRKTVHWWDWREYDNLEYVEIKVRPN